MAKSIAESKGKKKFIYGARAILNLEKETEETFESKHNTDSMLRSITSDSDSMSSATESSIKVDDDEEVNF